MLNLVFIVFQYMTFYHPKSICSFFRGKLRMSAMPDFTPDQSGTVAPSLTLHEITSNTSYSPQVGKLACTLGTRGNKTGCEECQAF